MVAGVWDIHFYNLKILNLEILNSAQKQKAGRFRPAFRTEKLSDLPG